VARGHAGGGALMRAVIMAGGRGSRLAPLTTVLPKPLMPLSDRPILDVLLRQLVRDGVRDIAISVGHLGGIIEAWVRNEADFGVPIGFLYEDTPLGTAGALRNVPDPDGTFLAMNGDILTDLKFADLVRHHEASGAIATMAVNRREVAIEYGVVHTDTVGNIARLEEKPRLTYTVSMGIYAFDPAIIELIGAGERVDFPDLLTRAIDRGETVSTFPFEGYWRDIGNRDDYEAAIAEFSDDVERFIGPS
jgi:NDP-sugar pyrophosphorylase family protein